MTWFYFLCTVVLVYVVVAMANLYLSYQRINKFKEFIRWNDEWQTREECLAMLTAMVEWLKTVYAVDVIANVSREEFMSMSLDNIRRCIKDAQDLIVLKLTILALQHCFLWKNI